MKAERWQQIEQLFHAVLQREPGERTTFLAQTCSGDESLYKEVTSLLSSYDQTDSFFEATASSLAAEMFGNKVGETIGPYEVLSVLGSGGMGTVYLAQDARLGRKIALKLLPPQFTNDRDRLRRFQQEARAASALNHPNILTVHEIEQRSDLHYIATEFVDGVTLRQQMGDRCMDLSETLNVAIQVASALDAAHAAGIAHRDIKPENVMIRSDGYVKVLDFGLAKLTERPAIEDADQILTALNTDPGIVMGTPRYMSPEQARGLEVDSRTDIFSLGVMVYEMIAGRVPFDGATPSDVIASLLKDEPAPLAHWVPEVPIELEHVVQRALARDRNDRYQSVAEMSAHLQQLKEEIQLNAKLGLIASAGSRARTTGSDHIPTIATRRFKSTDPKGFKDTKSVEPTTRKRWAIAFGFAALLLVVIGVVSIVSRGRRKIAPPSQISFNARAITTRGGFITAARFTHDGKRVIYSAGFDGRPMDLIVANWDGSEARSLGLGAAALKSVSKSGKIAILLNFELSWNDGHGLVATRVRILHTRQYAR